MTSPADVGDSVGAKSPSQSALAASRPFRFWPILVLAALIWVCRQVPSIFPDSNFAGFMVMAIGPFFCGLLMIAWWLFFSRETGTTKWLGVLAIVGIGVACNFLADESMQGFGLFMFTFPWAFTAFGMAMTFLSRAQHKTRAWGAVLATSLPFLAMLPLRTDGVWGNMKADISWRWAPTQSQWIVERLKKLGPAAATQAPPEWSPEGPVVWGEFRGPHRDGKSVGVALDPDWERHPPKELWRRPMGPGWGSVIVVGDRLFTQEQRGEEEMVVAYQADTGSQIWVHADKVRFHEKISGSGPRATPTYHDGKLYTMGAAGAVDCLNAATGELIWTRNLPEDSGAKPPMWGFSSSPLVAGDVVLVHAGGMQAPGVDSATKQAKKGLVAYDTATGAVNWTAPAGDHGYSSPQLVPPEVDGGEPRVLLLSNSGLSAHDLVTGAILWSNPWTTQMYRVIQPVSLGDGSFLIGTPMGGGTRRIEVTAADGGYAVKELWTTNAMKPYFNDYVEHKGFLYGFDGDLFACVDLANGKRMWKKGRYGNGQVVLLPDGDQLIVQAEDGEVVLLAADPKSHRELGKLRALDKKTWNHPVVVGDRLYVRNGDEGACYELALAGGKRVTEAAVKSDAGAATNERNETQSSPTPTE